MSCLERFPRFRVCCRGVSLHSLTSGECSVGAMLYIVSECDMCQCV